MEILGLLKLSIDGATRPKIGYLRPLSLGDTGRRTDHETFPCWVPKSTPITQNSSIVDNAPWAESVNNDALLTDVFMRLWLNTHIL